MTSQRDQAGDDHPHQPESDEAEPEKQTTPGGVIRDLEEQAEETGAETDPEPEQRRPTAKP
jgi:hypothetical protein